MKRFFGKSSKSEHSADAAEEEKGSIEVIDETGTEGETKNMEGARTKKKTQSRESRESVEDAGQGDAEKSGQRKGRASKSRGLEEDLPKEPRKTGGGRKQKIFAPEDVVEPIVGESHEDDDEPSTEFIKRPPRPLPRRVKGSTSLFSPSDSEQNGEEEIKTLEEEEIISPRQEDKQRKSKAVSGKKGKGETTKTKAAKKVSRGRGSGSGLKNGDSGGSGDLDHDDQVQYVNVKDSPGLPKLEPGKGGNYFSSIYNYKQPVSSFRFRARLLKYPAFNEQQAWNGEMAVVDERVFKWQEKVFSKAEAKKYQKLDNCITEHERKYHEELGQNDADVIGKYLHSYVADDLYVVKKKMRLLTKRCPVPHTRSKEKNFSRLDFDTSTRSDRDSLDMEGQQAGDDNNYFDSDDSIDFDEPISSSTPKQSRKGKGDKVKAGASEIAKAEKRSREKKEKELKDLERTNVKLKQERLKKEKDLEKRRLQENAKEMEKVRKIEAIESKEKELKAEYMKKYKYSKRPSMPLGARMRSVRLTPSPGKLERKKKSYTLSRSSEISDFPEDEMGSGHISLDSNNKDDNQKSERLTATAKVGTEYEEYRASGKGKFNNVGIVGSTGKDFRDGVGYKNTQSMYIMATIPYLPGKYREVVVCSVQNIPNQQVLVFKPGLGYRNIEAKRNNVFRISCEICPTDGGPVVSQQEKAAERKAKSYSADANIQEDLGFFESVPKNEFRLCVLGEICSAHGFDSSPLCIYYAVDIPKGWRNDSLLSNTEGMTHSCFTDDQGFAHFSHEFSFQLVFSMDFIDEPDPNRHFPTPVIALMVVSMNHPSPRIIYEGYGYASVPMTPGCHFVKIRTWKPRPRSVVEKMRAAFLDISPSLQDMKLAHITTSTDNDDNSKANLIGLQTDPSGSIKLRLHVIHQSPSSSNKEYESNLDLLEKMSSATILKSVQAVISAFQRARQKAETLKSQYD